MAGKPGSVNAIIARRAKVAEYKAQYMRNTTIASMLGVTEHTVMKDLQALREGFEEQIKLSGGKELAHAMLLRHERMLEKISVDIAIAEEALRINLEKVKANEFDKMAEDRVRYWRKEIQGLRDQHHRVELTVAKFYQTVGFMPRVAERLDVTQRVVENPLQGLVDDEVDGDAEASPVVKE